MEKSKLGHHPKNNKNQPVIRHSIASEHHTIISTEINGIEMGVLQDGTPFLTLRGLAAMCGIDHAPLQRLASNWGAEVSRPRGKKILALLEAQGHPGDFLYIRVSDSHGRPISAFCDSACMAILEYYAFEAGRYATEKAKNSFRKLARKSFRDFIYQQCGYDPNHYNLSLWQPFHDRVSILHNTVPAGYFGIFHVISELFVTLGQNGIHTDKRFLPDISVGIMWARHWEKIKGNKKYGSRIKYDHNYPTYYPQALSNPQDPWAYPDESLAEFRRWFREDYIQGGKLASYLSTQSSKKLPAVFVKNALEAFAKMGEEQKISS